MTLETRDDQDQQTQQPLRAMATKLQRAAEPIREQLSSAYDTAQQRSGEAIENVESYIKQSPWKALAYSAGIAALVGIVGTALLGRRGKSSEGGARSEGGERSGSE